MARGRGRLNREEIRIKTNSREALSASSFLWARATAMLLFSKYSPLTLLSSGLAFLNMRGRWQPETQTYSKLRS
jgi:hypothetical protein